MPIRLDGIEVTYPNGTVGLAKTSLQLRPTDVTVLLGRSGAGKSTLLRSLNLLVPPTKGEVVADRLGPLRGGNVLREHRRRTAMVFQQHQLLPRMSALQNVMIARLSRYGGLRTLFPLPRAEMRWGLECLARVGLLEKALNRCDSLSGGEQQRVGIARALAQSPKLILADEPVASLDPATSNMVLSTLRDISRADGIPAVVSLHQLELATSFADRIIGLAGGSVVFDGSPKELTGPHLKRIYGDLPDVTADAA